MPSIPPWIIAHAVLSAVVIIPSFVLGVLSTLTIKTKDDQARIAVPWLRIAFFALAVYCIFDTAAAGVTAVPDQRFNSDDGLVEASQRLYAFALFAQHLTGVAVMFCMANYASGVWFATNGKMPRGFRPVVFAIGGLVSTLSFVVLVRNQVFETQIRQFRGQGSSAGQSQLYFSLAPFTMVDFAAWGMQSVCSIGVSIFAMVTRARASKDRGLNWGIHKSVKNNLLSTAILLLVLGIWSFPYIGMWGTRNFISTLLNGWLSLVILILVYITASKTTDGLWSSPQTIEKAPEKNDMAHFI